jgi:hypothetical protein
MIEKVLNKRTLHQEDNDYLYWRSKSEEERISAIEALRQPFIQTFDNVQQRLQRVYRIIRKAQG